MILFLAGFAPLQPSPGLAIWSVLIFLGFWYLMYKKALKPIMSSLKSREDDIQKALDTASQARQDIDMLKADNEMLINEARKERALMLTEAKETKEQIIKEAKEKAKQEASRLISAAQVEILAQQNNAMQKVKAEAGQLAIAVAEKLLKAELSKENKQNELIDKIIKDIQLN